MSDDWSSGIGCGVRQRFRRLVPQSLVGTFAEIMVMGEFYDRLTKRLFIQPDGLADDAILERGPEAFDIAIQVAGDLCHPSAVRMFGHAKNLDLP